MVKPNSRKEIVEKIEKDRFIVRANAPAKEGKANKRAIELLSEYYGISKNRICLMRGNKSKEKEFDIT